MVRRFVWGLVLIAFSGGAFGSTLTVCQECQHQSIQEAVDIAAPGDVIVVQAGTYREEVTVDKPLTLLGSRGNRPLVDAGGRSRGFVISAKGVVLEEFAVTNSTVAGIEVLSEGNAVRYNLVTDNRKAGIKVTGNGNIILGNDLHHNSAGILLETGEGCEITGNNASENGDGIVLLRASKIKVRGNVVSYNRDRGIQVNQSQENTLALNLVSHNGYGISLDELCSKNLIFENLLWENRQNALDQSGANQWDNGFVGNNYSDLRICRDFDWNHRCDEPYVIPGGSSLDRNPQIPWPPFI